MKISTLPPPIYDRAKENWGVDFYKGTVCFTYGDTLHIANGQPPVWLIPHESVHAAQQGNNPASWWDKYFDDPEFRLAQELEAYRAQYAWIRSHVKGREQQFRYLVKFANDVSSRMYGGIINFSQALTAIKQA